MNEEGKFWVATWTVLAVVSVTIAITTASYWKDHNAKVAEMVLAGVNPVSVMCALQDSFGDNPVCMVLATKGEE